MSRAIRFTQGEREAVEWAVVNCFNKKLQTKFENLLVKMKAAEQPREGVAPGLGWREFSIICKNVLGERLVLPAVPTQEYMIITSKAIRVAGLNPDTALQAALAARRMWKGKIKLESIVRQANVLLSEYKEDMATENQASEGGLGAKWTLEEFDPDSL